MSQLLRAVLWVSLGLGFGFARIPAVLAADTDPNVASQTSVGVAGVPESISSVMQRQAQAGAPQRKERDQEEKTEKPDRSGLPVNPASPQVPQLPELPPDFKPQLGELQAESPQTVGTNFTAATLAGTNPTLSFPPDSMGAVGLTQYITFVNGRLVTFNKTTGVADGVLNADPDVFFNSVRNGSFTSDPRIRYDRLTARWFLVIINVSTPNRILLAVSDAASAGVISPSTVFTFFFIPINSTPPAISNTCLADYPTLGLDANALYIGTNNFCGSPAQTFNSTDGYVVRKSSILGAGPLVVTVFRGMVASAAAAGPYTPQGVDNLSPTATEGYFIGVDNLTFGTLMMRRISNPGGTPTISSNISITVPATASPLLVPHQGNTGGTNGQLSSLDDRLFAAHIRGGRLWTAHNIGVNNTGTTTGTRTRNGARWYELNVPVGSGTPTIVQSGTVFTASATNLNDQRHYWVPSIMVTGQGHAALGFSTAGSAERANSATVGRLASATLGTMGTPVLFTSSSTAYNPPSDPGSTGVGRRWGDYTYTSVDPQDDQTLWTVQQFCDATNSYGVRVAKLLAPPPALPGAVGDVDAGANPVAVTLTGTSAGGSGFFDPGADLPGVPPFSHLAVSISAGSATGTPPSVISATYVSPTTIDLVLNAAAATPSIGSERYTVTVTNPDGQVASAAVLRVVSTGPVVTLAAGPSGAEGNAGSTAFDFVVNLSSPATALVTVEYQTADGSALASDGDYQATNSSLQIAIGETFGVISIPVSGDVKFEGDETFTVTLTAATNASLGVPAISTATIVNDDDQPSIGIADALPVAEGDAGQIAVTFGVTLSHPSAFDVSSSFTTADGSATVADGDFAAATGTVTIPALQTSGSVQVQVAGDTRYEADETFGVTLSDPSGATLGTAAATVTITDDDQPPAVAIDGVSQAEGDAGTQSFVFTVSLSEPSGLAATADFATSDGTATLADGDYQPTTGIVNFPPGVITQPITVLVNGDTTLEPDEQFDVTLSNLVGLVAGTLSGAGTILNDETAPVVSIDDIAVAEGNSGSAPAGFTVSLSHATTETVTVQYQTADGSATVADADYQVASGQITLLPTTLSAPLPVPVNGDPCGEGDEAFTVTLSDAVGAVLGSATGTCSVENDDDATAPTVTVVSPNGGEMFEESTLAEIQWTATDLVGVTDVDILLSRDGGSTFPETLILGLANTGSFSWAVTGPITPGNFAVIRVVAHDAGCNVGDDVSDAAFQISNSVTAAPEEGPVVDFALGLPRPNPTNGSTEIGFALPRTASARVSVVDVRGREVTVLVDRTLAAGRYRATWTGQTASGAAARGVYFIRFEAGGQKFHRRLVLVR